MATSFASIGPNGPLASRRAVKSTSVRKKARSVGGVNAIELIEHKTR